MSRRIASSAQPANRAQPAAYGMTKAFNRGMVGRGGLEPPTSRLSGVRSNHLSYRPIPVTHWKRPKARYVVKATGGARRDRTDDLMLAKHALSQLSYGPRHTGKADALRPKVMLIRRRKRNEGGGGPRFLKRQDPTRSVSFVPSVPRT